MPPKEDKVVKNVDFNESTEKNIKKMKKIKEEKHDDDDDEENEDNEEVTTEEDVNDNDEEDDEDDDDNEDDEDFADGLTDIGLYNVLGNFLVDEDGNSIATSLSNIAKELGKLNHTLKKYVSKA
jgi:hypothetical protein